MKSGQRYQHKSKCKKKKNICEIYVLHWEQFPQSTSKTISTIARLLNLNLVFQETNEIYLSIGTVRYVRKLVYLFE